MYSFLFRTLSSARSRTIGILLAFFLSASILFLLIFVFQNIREGVTYYTLQGIQENRITITHSSNILQLLDRDI